MVVKFNHLLPAMPELGMGLPNAYNKGPPGNGTFSRSADSDLNDADTTKLWQGLLTLPLGRPKVSNPKPGGRPTVQQTAGVWRPAPNRQLEIRKLFPARS